MVPDSTPSPGALPTPDRRPTVYGYLRAIDPDEIELAAQAREIGLFCREQGYRLETVVVDRHATGDMVVRAGFTGLLDVLELEDSHGVVVLNLEHISGNNHALALMQRLIRRTGSKVIVIHQEEDTTKADGA